VQEHIEGAAGAGTSARLVRSRAIAIAASAVAALLVAACGEKAAGPGGPGGMQMPPPTVGVVTVAPTSLPLTTELPGRLESSRVAQVRARVNGIVLERRFEEGSLVKAGQSLFQIDPAPYQAQLDSAIAAQGQAEAAAAQTASILERDKPLVAAKAISTQEFIAAETAHKQAIAQIAVAKAAVTQARLSVTYARVDSPIAGRIGRALVSEGQLVTQAEATVMATVQQIDPLYINITQSADDALKLKRSIASGKVRASRSGSTPVEVVLDDGSVYGHHARLLFTDWTVDPTSGQVMLRAEVPNPQGDLLPGLYVKVRLSQASSDTAMVVPQQSVTRSAAGDTVMVVGADNQVTPRPVKLGGSRGNQWIVLEGLNPGERVVADGFQKIRPKVPVTPVPWTPVVGGPGAPAPVAPGASSPAPSVAASR
jgi:membrane fusion protein (multidrug efflux system)